MINSRVCTRLAGGALIGIGLMSITTSTMAQRSENLFRGIWKGTLTPDIIVGVPAADVERLSQPFNFELRVFNRGKVEAYFLSPNEEWEVTTRDFQLTEIGENGVILGRLVGTGDASQNGFSFNFTKVDDNTLLFNWSMLSTQQDLRFDGFDEIGFGGVDVLKLEDD